MEIKDLTASQKKWAIRVLVVFLVGVLLSPLYKGKDDSRVAKSDDKQVVDVDKHTFEDSILANTQADIREIRESLNSFKSKQLEKLDAIAADNRKELESYKNELKKEAERVARASTKKDKDEIIEAVIKKTGGERLANNRQKKGVDFDGAEAEAADRPNFRQENVQRRKSSGIKVIKPADTKGNKNIAKKGKDTSSKKTVYIPPGTFTEASLLSGVVASTAQASDNQVPMIIRVNDLAILPNEFRQDIKGCFFVANGEGNLAQERVMTRLVTLSCISKDGHSVIDEKVKGWVIDSDGRAGMRGKVVAKFGAHTARVALAGAISGFGEVFSETANVTYSGAYGSSRQLKDTELDTLAQAGVGGSLTAVADDLEEFYLNLAEQTLPVIEVGPTKKITVAFAEGAELEIKKRF